MRSTMLYFAYGSNMESGRIKAANRCPHAEFVCVARLQGHRLAFTRKSKDGHGVADAVANGRHVIWGVVWRLTVNDVERLDEREGARAAQPKYVRRPVTLRRRDDGKELSCETYFVPDEEREEQGVPSTKQYVGYLRDGAQEHKLPRHYVAKLRQLWRAAPDNPADRRPSSLARRGLASKRENVSPTGGIKACGPRVRQKPQRTSRPPSR